VAKRKPKRAARAKGPQEIPEAPAHSGAHPPKTLKSEYPRVRFPRLALPLPGAEPQGLEPAGTAPAPRGPGKITVLVYNRNGADKLWNFLFSLKAQTRPPDEILVVDNKSGDASVSFMRTNHPDVRILELQESFARAQALNLGFLSAGGDQVVWVDSSLALPPEWLKRLGEAFETRSPEAGAVVSPVHGKAGWEGVEVRNILGRVLGREGPVPGGELFLPALGAVMLDRRLFPEGPFESQSPTGDDPFALGWSLQALGRKVFWAFEAKVLRPGDPPPAPGTFRLDLAAERGRWAAFYTFAEGRTLAKLFPLFLADALVRPFSRWFRPEGSFWGSALGNLTGLWLWGSCRAARKAAALRRRSPDSAGTRLLSGRLALGQGLTASLVNAFAAAYLAAVGLPTREQPRLGKDRVGPLEPPGRVG